jgi:hypothetical protein
VDIIHSGLPNLSIEKHKLDVLKYLISFLDLIKEKEIDHYFNYKS